MLRLLVNWPKNCDIILDYSMSTILLQGSLKTEEVDQKREP